MNPSLPYIRENCTKKKALQIPSLCHFKLFNIHSPDENTIRQKKREYFHYFVFPRMFNCINQSIAPEPFFMCTLSGKKNKCLTSTRNKKQQTFIRIFQLIFPLFIYIHFEARKTRFT